MRINMTEDKLLEIMLAIADDVAHDRIQAVLKIVNDQDNDIQELGRQLHNAWKGNKDYRKEIDSLHDEICRLEAKEKVYQDSLRFYVEENAKLRNINAMLRKQVLDLEDQVETLDNPSLPDEPDHSQDIQAQLNISRGANAYLREELDKANNHIARRDQTVAELTDQLLNPIKPIDYGPEPTH